MELSDIAARSTEDIATMVDYLREKLAFAEEFEALGNDDRIKRYIKFKRTILAHTISEYGTIDANRDPSLVVLDLVRLQQKEADLRADLQDFTNAQILKKEIAKQLQMCDKVLTEREQDRVVFDRSPKTEEQ